MRLHVEHGNSGGRCEQARRQRGDRYRRRVRAGPRLGERFAEEGARLALLDLDGAERAAEAIDGARALTADVTDETALTQAVATVTERLGPPDVLHANAGIPGEGRVHELSLQAWNRVIAVHLTGVFLSAKAVLPAMLAPGRRLEHHAVERRRLGRRSQPPRLRRGLGRRDRARPPDGAPTTPQHGIRTIAICPGTVRTPLVEDVYPPASRRRRGRGARSPRPRLSGRTARARGGHRQPRPVPRLGRGRMDHRRGLPGRRRGDRGVALGTPLSGCRLPHRPV